jgi:hypothetical protein
MIRDGPQSSLPQGGDRLRPAEYAQKQALPVQVLDQSSVQPDWSPV